MESKNVPLQRQFWEEEVKRLSKQFADCVKRKVSTQLKIEETEAEYMKELKIFQQIEEEMTENIHELEDQEKDKEIDAKLTDLQEKDEKLKESITETEESIKKLQSIKRTEVNRIKCSERRVEALERQFNTLVYTKKQLINKIRRSVENQKV